MKYPFDVLVIGSGPGGSSVAMKCAKGGKTVAVVDQFFGGTCALHGCTPKKAMESVSSMWWQTKALSNSGFPAVSEFLRWKALQAHKDSFTTLVPFATIQKFEAQGIKCITGRGQLLDENKVEVNGTAYSAQHIVIATGAKPRTLDIEGEALLRTSSEFFEFDDLPQRIIFVGGGYIAFELAHISAACGSQVTILNDEIEPLPNFDFNLVKSLHMATSDKGIDVRLGFPVELVQQDNEKFHAQCLRTGTNEKYEFFGDTIIHAAGRSPNIPTYGGQIKLKLNGQQGIATNDMLQCDGLQSMYALGDARGCLPFTESAVYEASIVVHNILHPSNKKAIEYAAFPVTMFTSPKLAQIGMTEKNLQDNSTKYEIIEGDLSGDLIEESGGMAKYSKYRVFVDPDNGLILGAGILSTHADDLINLFAMAMQLKIKFTKLSELRLSYPSATHAFKHMITD